MRNDFQFSIIHDRGEGNPRTLLVTAPPPMGVREPPPPNRLGLDCGPWPGLHEILHRKGCVASRVVSASLTTALPPALPARSGDHHAEEAGGEGEGLAPRRPALQRGPRLGCGPEAEGPAQAKAGGEGGEAEGRCPSSGRKGVSSGESFVSPPSASPFQYWGSSLPIY